jgi:hypothetical protein
VIWHGRYVSNLALPLLIQTEADGCNVALQWLNVLSLKAVSHWDIAQLVPLYVNLSKKSGLELTALRRLLRHAMTNGMFTEKTKNHVAHNSMSRILVEDPKTAAWVDLQTETIFLGGAHQCEALDRWPGSKSKRETGAPIGFHNPGQTSLYEEIKKKPDKIQKFGLAMELFSSGEGYEPDSLVEGYDWSKLGEGTVVDVSYSLILSRGLPKYIRPKNLTIAGGRRKWIRKLRHI